jgi:alkylation response protein AidB-like acyl-CoA dehydrogenase
MQGRPIIAGSLAELSDDELRARIRDWLIENLTGRFAGWRGAGGPGREHEAFEERLAWDQHLAAAGWTALSWPVTYGGRGATAGQQMIFHEEYADPVLWDRIAQPRMGFETVCAYAVATITSEGQPAAGTGANASVMKLLWSRWHRALGEVAVDVQGPRALLASGQAYELDAWQRLHLFSQADTIYSGSDEIQLGIIAGRALGLPREPAPGQDRA